MYLRLSLMKLQWLDSGQGNESEIVVRTSLTVWLKSRLSHRREVDINNDRHASPLITDQSKSPYRHPVVNRLSSCDRLVDGQ